MVSKMRRSPVVFVPEIDDRRSQQLKIRRCRLMKNNFNEFVFKRESVEVTFSDIFEMTLSLRVEIEVEV